MVTGAREYSGGPCEAIASATVLLEIPICLAIRAFGNFSLTCNLRINAQSSKVITSPSWISAHFSSVTSAQFSSVIDTESNPRARGLGGPGRPDRVTMDSSELGLLDSSEFPCRCRRLVGVTPRLYRTIISSSRRRRTLEVLEPEKGP